MLGQLGINESIFVMFGMFVVTFLVVSLLALNKLSTTLVERESRMHGREDKAAHLVKDLDSIREQVKQSMNAARAQANTDFLAIRAKAVEEQRNIITTAREKASVEMKQARDNVQQQIATEVKKLEGDIPRISKAILDKVLEQAGSDRATVANIQSGAE